MEKRPNEGRNLLEISQDPKLLDRDQARLLLEQIVNLAGDAHPAIRRGLVSEAQRLWRAAGITEPVSNIQESPRRRAIRERLIQMRRKRKRQGALTAPRLWK